MTDAKKVSTLKKGRNVVCLEVLSENQRKEFVRDGSPSSWLEYGEELRDAAEILWSREEDGLKLNATLNRNFEILARESASGVSKPYMLLAGFALENVLKGMLVARRPEHITSGSLSNELSTHDIVRLAKRTVGLSLSKQELEFCKSVSDAIPYWGRYPIPLRKTQLMPSIALTKGMRKTFLRLFDRLASSLYWDIRDGWDSGIGVQLTKMRSRRYGDVIHEMEPLHK